MQTEMNLLETWTLPDTHPLKQAERDKAEQWQVDFSREGKLGVVAIRGWVVINTAGSHDIRLSDAA